MEIVGVSRIFLRSEKNHRLQYTQYYGDGDSKSFMSVKDTYGLNRVTKFECIGHVQKRVDSRLRKLKTKTKGLSGKGKLTDNFIDRLQNYYGIAVRSNVAVGDLNLSKSHGPDGIYGQKIAHLGEQAKLRLLDIISLSWSGDHLPRNWKNATMLPIRKPDKEATSSESYRHITLTSIPRKIMEKMILTKLTFHLTSKILLPKK
ncbi:uncharacterized protein TNCV_597941 [Trichonephila clavipes]|nr:uncharacterized protein TNCV_597941 [Trichonephila clavipes]